MVNILHLSSAWWLSALYLRAQKLRARLRREWPALMIVLLPVLILSPSLVAGHAATASDIITVFRPWIVDLSPGNASPKNMLLGDEMLQGSPWIHFIHSELTSGRFPLWDTYVAGGTPFLAAAQPATLYPLTWLEALLPYPFGLTIAALFQWWLAGLGMYVFTRTSLSLRQTPALVASLSFMFSSFIVVWLIHPVGRPAVWFPWLFWASERVIQAPSRQRIVLLAVVMGLAGLTGHPEMVFNITMATILYALWLVCTSPSPGWNTRLKRLFCWGSGLLLGFGLTAVQYFTTLQELPLTLTAGFRSEHPAGTPLHPSSLLSWLVPNLWGNQTLHNKIYWGPANYNEVIFYAGAVALVLAGIAVLELLRKPERWRSRLFFVLLGAIFMLVIYGVPPFYWLMNLPGLRFDPMLRLNLLPISAVSILAGFGCQDILGWATSRQHSGTRTTGASVTAQGGWNRFRRSWPLIPAGLVVLAVAIGSVRVLTRLAKEQPTHIHWMILWVGFALALVGTASSLIFLRWRGWLGGRIVLGALVLLMLGDQLVFAVPYVPQPEASQAYPQTATITRLQQTIGTDRMAAAGYILPPDSGLTYQLSDLRAYEPTASMRYRNFMVALDPSNLRTNVPCCSVLECPSPILLSAASVVYYATLPEEDANTCQPLPLDVAPSSDTFVPLWTQGGLTLWRNTQARPRFYFANQVIPSSGESQSVQELSSLSLTGREAVIEGVTSSSASSTGQAHITAVKDVPGEISLRTQSEAGQWLIIDESYDPGWQAEIDGAHTTIHPANEMFQAVWVPAGTHTIYLAYRPTGFTLGLGASALALLGLLSLLLSEWIRLRPRCLARF